MQSNEFMESNEASLTICASVGHPDCKRRGEASEAEFIARCTSLDLAVAKPWGDDDPYDVLVRWERIFWRVQVKSSGYCGEGGYRIRTENRSGRYSKRQIDFLAGHIVPADAWYIVPIEAIGERRTGLRLNPGGKGQWERYREAWCLLACAPPARGWKGIPVICRCRELPVRCAVCPNSHGTDTPVRRL
jgi:hypothetical protein